MSSGDAVVGDDDVTWSVTNDGTITALEETNQAQGPAVWLGSGSVTIQ